MKRRNYFTGKTFIIPVLFTFFFINFSMKLAAAVTEPLKSEMDAELVGFKVDGVSYVIGETPPEIPAGQVFRFELIVKNTGTEAWVDDYTPNPHPATFLSRNPDYNSVFGTFLITPGHVYSIQPGDTVSFYSSLMAPSLPGAYTMVWQLAEWAPYTYDREWASAPFFGQEVTITVMVAPRTDSPPPTPGHVPGVVDEFDIEYKGSFTLPTVPNAIQDEKTFFASGITLRTVDNEKRMILTTGTYNQTVYEVAIPTPGEIVGSDVSVVPTAELRTVFGELSKYSSDNTNGTMYYDEDAELLYWTNYHFYLTGSINFPILRAANLAGGKLTEVAQWYLPLDLSGAPMKSFWGGVTKIPDDYANQYTGGKTLGVGFGGEYSINASASWGPALAAVDLPDGRDTMNLQPVFNYSITNPAHRDGNVFYTSTAFSRNPASPWEGWWGSGCTVGSGVFIDLPDKKGYVAFTRLPIGRVDYGYGGANWNPAYENVWYFYDYETLGQAATGVILRENVVASSMAYVNLPNEATRADQIITGSCFDPELRTLYVYSLHAVSMPGVHMYLQPLVHVYYVKEDEQDAINTVSQEKALRVWMLNSRLYVNGLIPDKPWSVYTITGQLVHRSIANSEQADIYLPVHGIYIVTSNNETVKAKY